MLQNLGKFGKFRKNREKIGKFGKIGKIRKYSGKNRGKTGEEPGKRRGRTGEPKTLPKKRKFCHKKNGEEPGNGGKTCPKCNLSNFDVESGNLTISVPFLGVLARFCCFCAFFVLFLLNFHEFGEFSITNFRKFWTKMQIENAE